mmetsp:Transcript_28961/g.27899  ORF Transcript_28961/g.27899 Transcript_28961/m.27899 type:complete len:204 (+) Transcript_28961:611-1222(+)
MELLFLHLVLSVQLHVGLVFLLYLLHPIVSSILLELLIALNLVGAIFRSFMGLRRLLLYYPFSFTFFFLATQLYLVDRLRNLSFLQGRLLTDDLLSLFFNVNVEQVTDAFQPKFIHLLILPLLLISAKLVSLLGLGDKPHGNDAIFDPLLLLHVVPAPLVHLLHFEAELLGYEPLLSLRPIPSRLLEGFLKLVDLVTVLSDPL